ncbi:hypothetical protein [Actinomadura sp. SCN-SB]|uniref:hypothetical protein n=1 Tax=Actinomadura sp. SCN-SB TaxID=3373092 RepID=UPI0037530CA3
MTIAAQANNAAPITWAPVTPSWATLWAESSASHLALNASIPWPWLPDRAVWAAWPAS